MLTILMTNRNNLLINSASALSVGKSGSGCRRARRLSGLAFGIVCRILFRDRRPHFRFGHRFAVAHDLQHQPRDIHAGADSLLPGTPPGVFQS